MPNVICDKCSGLHETYEHDLYKLTAQEFYTKYYFNSEGFIIPNDFTGWMMFAEAYAKAKRDGVPDIPGFVSHKKDNSVEKK